MIISNYEVIIASTRGNIVIMTKCTNVLMFRFQNISDFIGDCNASFPLCILHKQPFEALHGH